MPDLISPVTLSGGFESSRIAAASFGKNFANTSDRSVGGDVPSARAVSPVGNAFEIFLMAKKLCGYSKQRNADRGELKKTVDSH